ncbi:hypothetical protein GCM10007092_04590 [Thermus composti]|uniref:Uncharacterized protein n=1 Tax=Thermus composti TaxID=532059 RepID=A0ABV6Q3B5_9DEIN|nr:hypothetical protein [Thermus composti]GGM94379.1 hypothetical protein GCM10007092_04590 [Thermus composti]
MAGKGKGVLVLLYLLLTLAASTGVALQLYLMERQNPALKADCRAAQEKVQHSPLCGLQVAPGAPPIAPPAPPRPLPFLEVRALEEAGHPAPPPRALAPRAPPSALA